MSESPNAKNESEKLLSFPTGSTKAVDYKAIYTNQVQLAMTPFDVQLSLSQSTAPYGNPVNELIATVFFSPGQAKLLATMLTNVIADYEKQIGPITLPANAFSTANPENSPKK